MTCKWIKEQNLCKKSCLIDHVDSASMVIAISKASYKSLDSKSSLHQIAEIHFDVHGANGDSLLYFGVKRNAFTNRASFLCRNRYSPQFQPQKANTLIVKFLYGYNWNKRYLNLCRIYL